MTILYLCDTKYWMIMWIYEAFTCLVCKNGSYKSSNMDEPSRDYSSLNNT